MKKGIHPDYEDPPSSSVRAETRIKHVRLRRIYASIYAQNAIRSLPANRSWLTPADALSVSTSVSIWASNLFLSVKSEKRGFIS